MELRQLKYFQAVSRLKSITRAAEQLHIAQPAVSIAIKKLEEELGVQLFDRSQKQVALTVEGEIFLQRIDDILSRLQDTLTEISDYRTFQKGAIRVGVPPMIGAFLFPFLFNEFHQAYPQLELVIAEEGSLSIKTQLERGELDVGIMILSAVSPHLETTAITSGEIFVCLPPEHPLGRLEKVPWEELREQPFILLKEDTYGRQLVLEECTRHQFSPRVVFSSSQIETILGLVEQGTGITFLLDTIVRKHPNIISRPLTEPLFIEAGLVWNKDRYLSKATQAFIGFIRDFSWRFRD
ncbi:MAG: LysR family transcriptional regulator [Negativicutes bacterium]|nr:LysR family transcriptional regulator [Negativicutes bacterium]